MRNELVSVIMPAYNAAKYISESIDSVLRQDYDNWELIVIDDGSTDQTAGITKQYAASNDRIKYIEQPHAGQGKARNAGLQISSGEYVAFLDADDIWLPEKLSKQIEILQSTDADLVFSQAYLLQDENVTTEKINSHSGYLNGKDAVLVFLSGNQVPLLTAIAKRSSIQEVNGFTEIRGIHEDYDLWLRMLAAGQKFFGLDTALARYRIHSYSSSAGEGRMIMMNIDTLRNFSNSYPEFKAVAEKAIVDSINEYLANNNVTSWKMAGELIETRNELANKSSSVSYWKWIYTWFGKSFFRRIFKLRMGNDLRKIQ